MCKYCFDKQYESFASRREFQDFDLILTQKLGKEYLLFVENVTLNFGGIGYYIYKCHYCKTVWYLSEPDEYWRGFFLPKKQAKVVLKSLQKKDSRLRWGCVLVSIIVVMAILVFILR